MEGRTSGFHKRQGPVDLGLVILELALAQGDVEPARIKEGPALKAVSIEVVQSCRFSPRTGSWRAGAAGAVTVGAGRAVGGP